MTGLPVSQDDAVDPLTGMTYLAEAQEYGSVATAEAEVSQFGLGSATGSGYGVEPVSGSPAGTTGAYQSDAAWSQAVQSGLPAATGWDAGAVATALGQLLAHQPLSTAGTPSPWEIVNTAIAEYGAPPSGIQPIQAPPSGPAATATVPAVEGKSVADAVTAISAAGLVPGAHSTGTGTVNGQTPAAGTTVAPGSKVDLSVGTAATGGPGGPPPVTNPDPSSAVTVPDVIGKQAGEAHNILVNAGLKVSNRPNSGYTVTAITPKAGTKVKRGTSIDITAKAKAEA